jgi:hypothetical protein
MFTRRLSPDRAQKGLLASLFPLGLACLLVLAAAGSAQDHVHHGADNGNELGVVDFRVSCDAAAEEDFNRATALMHHMMYQEARATFEAIAAEHSDCAMAHWGIAQTLFQPLWPARPDAEARTRGWELTQKALELGPATDRERALVEATAAFFHDPGADEWWPRIQRWADGMAAAYEAHSDDLEVAALYGLSVLAAGQIADDQLAWNARAAEVLAAVHEEEPRHPGAIHYTIHANDVTGRAHQNLDVVEAYGEVAPSVAHALHMPSHIYVRLGDWPAVIEWNRRSADAALESSPPEYVLFHHIHALDYLLYGYLQMGDDARAAAVLDEGLSTSPYQQDFASAFHLAVMPARFLLEREAWSEAADLRPDEPGYLNWDAYHWARALSWYARGLGAARSGDPSRAREAESEMAMLGDRAGAAGESAMATYIEVDRLILAGWIAFAEGDAEAAVGRIEEATRLEQTVEKHPITPGALLPPWEALGDLLRELDRPGEALAAYEAGLEVWPARYRSVLGAARTAAEAGEDARARAHYTALLELVDTEASERPGVREAQEALSRPQ